MRHEVPSRPWEQIGVDLFELNKKEFMVTVDNYSNFWEINRLTSTTSAVIILKLKTILHGMVALTTWSVAMARSSPHQSLPSALKNGTSNIEPTALAAVKQTGKWKQQSKQRRRSSRSPGFQNGPVHYDSRVSKHLRNGVKPCTTFKEQENTNTLSRTPQTDSEMSTGRFHLELVGSNPTGAKFSLVRGDSQISFKRVATQGDLVYRQYCLLPAP